MDRISEMLIDENEGDQDAGLVNAGLLCLSGCECWCCVQGHHPLWCDREDCGHDVESVA